MPCSTQQSNAKVCFCRACSNRMFSPGIGGSFVLVQHHWATVNAIKTRLRTKDGHSDLRCNTEIRVTTETTDSLWPFLCLSYLINKQLQNEFATIRACITFHWRPVWCGDNGYLFVLASQRVQIMPCQYLVGNGSEFARGSKTGRSGLDFVLWYPLAGDFTQSHL